MADKPCCKNETCSTCQAAKQWIAWHQDGDQMRFRGQAEGIPVARVNGIHYVVQPYNHNAPPQYLGFGGTRFTFRFHDGREITSNDVMCQGEIPARFHDRLPDNAVIVPQEPARSRAPFGTLKDL
ncbi:hypothetical protein [Streptomyces sp. NPDC004783]|uniref:hypothetical protein n=1 Tax=Streptomyces sp. NPDC004783 TaxID=3154459 RepID=UPI0033B65B70